MDMDSFTSDPDSDWWSWAGLEDLGFDNVQLSLSEVSTPYKGLAVTFLLLLLYVLYYLSCVVNKPKLVGGEKGLRQYLLERCPCLSERYWPTIWAFQCHLTTILRVMLQKCPTDVVKYMREIVTLSDGGELALDWASLPNDSSQPDPTDQTPILLILPGITGCSVDNYVMHLVYDGILTGYRPLVLNQRGNGGLYLKTMRTYSGTDIRDLSEVIHRIQCYYPESPIVGVGVSLGGMLLTQYLHQLGRECNLSAVIAISVAWEPFRTRESLEKNLANRTLYSRFIVSNLLGMVKRNADRLSPEQRKELPFCLDSVMKSSTVSEFDHHLTVPLFGYSSLEDYYNDCRNSDKIHKIDRPYICITAADDPFVPKDSIPEKEFMSNSNTLLIMTSHGGHFGFLEGMSPAVNATWMNKICRQLLTALKHYK